MATQTTGGGSVTSFTNTPQARDDNYAFLEDVLRANTSLYDAVTGTIFLDVMANDLGGSAKTLFSVEDGDGNPLTADFDLLVKDANAAGVSLWEETFNHNWVRINNGKIEYRIADGSGVPGHGRSVDSLTAGQVFADQFVYAIRLGNGTLSEATVKINITGANDNASVAVVGASDNSVTEAGVNPGNIPYLGDSSASGTLVVNDADLGQNHFQNPSPGSLNGTYGAFAFNAANGQWTYTLNNSDSDTQALAQGASATDTLTVTSFDGTASYNIVVTITGTNDAPVAVADTNAGDAVVESGVNPGNTAFPGDASAAGNVLTNDSDVDTGDTKTVSLVNGSLTNVGAAVTGIYGSVTINANGSYSYSLDNADPDTQALAQGQVVTDQFTYQVKDANGATSSTTLTITITGTNDAPLITAQDLIGAVTEQVTPAGNLTDSGAITFTDVDLTDVHLVSATGTPIGTTLGTLSAVKDSDTTGTGSGGQLTWTYSVADSAVEYLAAGQTKVESFTITLDDQHGGLITKQIDVTITGTNDAPVAAEAIADQSSAEDAAWSFTVPAGSFTDVDQGATLTYTANLGDGSALPSWLTFNASTRNFSGTPPLDFNGIIDLKVTASDGSASASDTFQLTITAVNDAPVNTLPPSFTTNEDTSVKLGGLSVSDVDAGLGTINVTLSVASGTLTAATAGGVTITGSGTASIVLSGTLANINTYLATVANQPTYVPVVNANGAVTLTMTTSDLGNSGTGGTLTDTDLSTITITAVNDAPVGVNDTGSATEKGGVANGSGGSNGTGNVLTNDTDVDNTNASLVVSAIRAGGTEGAGTAGTLGSGLVGAHGTLTLNANGTYTYVVNENDAAVQALNTGGTLTDSFNYTVKDPGNLTDTAVLTITINGANDAPVVSVNGAATYAFGASPGPAVTIDSTIPVTDVDSANLSTAVIQITTNRQTGDTLNFTTQNGITGTYVSATGTLTLSGTATVAQYQVALESITFSSTSTSTSTRTVSFQATDSGGATSAAATASVSAVLDTVAPTVTATTSPSIGNTVGSVGTVTFQFSETVTGFTASDIILTRATLSNFTQIDGDTYTATLTRTATGSIKVDIAAGAFADLAGNTNAAYTSNPLPAGVAGSPINLALDHPAEGTPVLVTVTNLPAGWVIDGAIQQPDGSWTIETSNAAGLTVTTPVDFAGAMLLDVSLTWTNADGSTGSASVVDNVEAFAPGNPIFAWSGDDTLTGSSGADTFVFSQPIGADTVHNFDISADTIDLIGYGFTSFASLLANIADGAAGNAVITLASGQTITLAGVSTAALTAANFVFDVTPTVTNAGTITIGDGALLPMSGTIDNSGTISLGAQGAQTILELIQNGITLQGGGKLTLSDSAYNFVSGSLPSVTFNNVDNVISGAGQLGAGSLILTNGGTIIANGFNALVIDTGASSVINGGTIEATGSGGLVIVGSIVNSGLIWAAGGNVFIGGDLTGTGDVQISGSATVEIGGSDSNNVVVGSGAAGLLVLDDSIGFTGKISGLNADDRVDLRDIAFGANTTMTYADNGTGGGVLTVTDGVNSVHLALVGAYQLQNFSLVSDGQGGSLLTNNAGAATDYGSGVVDVTQTLSVSATTDVVADGYLRVTTTGLVQVDVDGGGNTWVTLGHVDLGAGQYTVQYLANGTPTTVVVAPVAPPIALDLNGDGVVSFISIGAGVTFDYGSGLVATAWVGARDGILVRDANHDGQVTATEIVFATSGSDLQGLAVYDSNHDGQLSSADAKFGEFAVWQDANSNGKVDAGELQSLTAQGIASISLSSDGVPYSAAGGDVSVVGTGSFTRADGTTGVLADAVFTTGSRPAEEQLRTMSTANTNVALIGAVAAAGLVAMPAAAAAHLGESSVPSGPDLTSAHNGVVSSLSVPAEGQATTIGDKLLQPAFDADSVAKFASHGESKEALPSSSDHGLTNPEAAPQSGPSELLAGTDTPAQSATIAAAVIVPSAEQLQAFIASSASAPEAHQSNEIVSKIMINALSGGKDDPDLDALINTLKGHGSGGTDAALPALASHAAALLPGVGMNAFGDFMVHQFATHGEAMALHPDAPHTAA